MKDHGRLLAFTIEGQRYALSLFSVERVVQAVEITPLPKAPDIVQGVINLHGRVIPVFNVRRRFRLPEKEIAPDDHMIIARTGKRAVSLAAERVEGVIDESCGDPVPSEEILPELEYVQGVVKLEEGLVLIHDLDTFLSLDEERKLDHAIGEESAEH